MEITENTPTAKTIFENSACKIDIAEFWSVIDPFSDPYFSVNNKLSAGVCLGMF